MTHPKARPMRNIARVGSAALLASTLAASHAQAQAQLTNCPGNSCTGSNIDSTFAFAGVSGTVNLLFPPSGKIVYFETLSGPTTFTVAGNTAAPGSEIELFIEQPSSGGFAVTLPASSTSQLWASGTVPTISTTAGSVSKVNFEALNGGLTVGGY